MASRYPDWDATFIPGTNGVLANKLGVTDPDELSEVEYGVSALNQRRIVSGEIPIARTYDLSHLSEIHQTLFSDVYDWAGKVRTYPMSKAGGLPFASPDQIGAYLDHAHQIVERTDWDSLDHTAFTRQAATVFASVNHAHPYREGNGRAAKIFMTQLARDHGWDLDTHRVSARLWNQASALSAPDRGTFEPIPDELFPVFERMTIRPPQQFTDTSPPQTTTATAAEIAARGPLSAGPSPAKSQARTQDTNQPPKGPHTRAPRRDQDDRRRGGPRM